MEIIDNQAKGEKQPIRRLGVIAISAGLVRMMDEKGADQSGVTLQALSQFVVLASEYRLATDRYIQLCYSPLFRPMVKSDILPPEYEITIHTEGGEFPRVNVREIDCGHRFFGPNPFIASAALERERE